MLDENARSAGQVDPLVRPQAARVGLCYRESIFSFSMSARDGFLLLIYASNLSRTTTVGSSVDRSTLSTVWVTVMTSVVPSGPIFSLCSITGMSVHFGPK